MTPAYVPRLPRRYAKHARGRRGERAYVSLRLPRDIIEILRQTEEGVSKHVEFALDAVYGHLRRASAEDSPDY